MPYSISHIAKIIDADKPPNSETIIEHLLLDSRRIHDAASSLFFALKGPRRDGHEFIPELFQKGIRYFVITESIDQSAFPDAVFLEVGDTLHALQQLVAFHRSQFSIPVIGITGSNGKTMVKEWLYQLLHEDQNIVRSPKSYNSQIGVPLSVWQMNNQHTLGIFEAGISKESEMIRLERVIQPTLGILTNLGEAHSEGFIDDAHKFREKIVLFRNCKTVIGREQDFSLYREALDMFADLDILTWGPSDESDFIISQIDKQRSSTRISLQYESNRFDFTIPFDDDASIENAITCFCTLLFLKVDLDKIIQRISRLHPVNMRLELKQGINQCIIINDSYSADLSSLDIALNFLNQQTLAGSKTVIISDFLQSAIPDEELYALIISRLHSHKIRRLIGIGERISKFIVEKSNDLLKIELYQNPEDFIKKFRATSFREESILIKGARIFRFERIVQLFEKKLHQTLLEINLNAIAHNLRQYQQLLQPSTKVMAMVKAFAYGSGGAEIAGILQYHKVDYLGVAYADEGVELRRAGIKLPIMVMNPDPGSFELIVEYDLEPELYSFEQLESFLQYLQKEGIDNYPVHVELETGMNRLGFDINELNKLSEELKNSSAFKIKSVFSHLAASEEAAQDDFTKKQYQLFKKAADDLEKGIGYSFIKHISNSAAVARHPALQMDMVRLGIGLYGVDSSGDNKVQLQTVARLRSTIAQIKHLKTGESVSYNRKAIVNRDSVIATVRIGYADGYPRRMGKGKAGMWVKTGDKPGSGKIAPIIGTVCMDMTMIDVTDIPNVQEGDEVIIFGEELPVQQLAEWADTIPYEIMTGISQRVKRVYFEES